LDEKERGSGKLLERGQREIIFLLAPYNVDFFLPPTGE
jgi:hypothetical protein